MDSATNATRFLVLGRGQGSPTGQDNTLLNVRIIHEPGSLAKVLSMFSKHGVNLSAIESFPDRESARRCYVWMEVEGHIDEAPLQYAMAELQQCTNSILVLGSFPRDGNRDPDIRTRTLNALGPTGAGGTHKDSSGKIWEIDAGEHSNGSRNLAKRRRT